MACTLAGYDSDVDFLVLDEPTSGFDPDSVDLFWHRAEALSQKTTLIISTHSIDSAAAWCDSVVLIKDGAIECHDGRHSHETLLNLYRNSYVRIGAQL